MRRTSLVVAFAGAALLPVAAQADVMLYGKIYAELANDSYGSGATQVEYSTLDDAQNLGRLGVKFSQDVGDGLQVYGQYEFALNAPDSTNNFAMRAAYVGLRGKVMSVAAGRFDGAYKITGGTTWDPFAFTGLQLTGTGGQSFGNFNNSGFIDHAIQFQADYTEGDTRFLGTLQYGADAAPTTTTTPKDSVLAGITFGYGSIDVIYAFAHDAANGATNQKFGVKVVATDLTFMIQAENVDIGGYDPGGVGQFLTGIVTYSMGNWLWVAEIGNYKSDYVDPLAAPDPIVDSNCAMTTLGGRYYLAKNAWVVFGMRNTDSKINSQDSSSTVLGLRYDF